MAGSVSLPQKKFFRARAHSNPLNDALFPVPICPDDVDWASHFPAYFPPRPPPHDTAGAAGAAAEAQGAVEAEAGAEGAGGGKTGAEAGSTVTAAEGAAAERGTSRGNPEAGEPRDTATEGAGTGAATATNGSAGSASVGQKRKQHDGGGEGEGKGLKEGTGEGKEEGEGKGDWEGMGEGEREEAGATGELLEAGSASTAAVQGVPGQMPEVRFADVGCGFGGMLVKLGTMYPDTLMVGMELRDKVSEYVKERIIALRSKHPGQYQNISVIRTNAMKYLPNYFRKGQLTKMFFLFPDPHFKGKNHRRRIITTQLLAEYAYVLAPGGTLYAITDVEELGTWMDSHLAAHPLFQKLTDAELEKDPIIPLLPACSEEAQKVDRNQGKTYMAVYRRIATQS